MFGRKRQLESKEFALNITSLMDILTIILIFLIISFSTEETEVTPPKDFKLPASASERKVKLAVKVSVGENDVRVEDKVVVRLSGGQFRESDLDASKHVVPLLKEMKRQKKRLDTGQLKFGDGAESQEEATQIVYFEAAKGTRSDTVDRVLKTSANAGFVKFRLAVMRKM
jgi:biopolymer transport protein ExbD